MFLLKNRYVLAVVPLRTPVEAAAAEGSIRGGSPMHGAVLYGSRPSMRQ